MSQKTHIEWATHTASPWFGCSKVSPGCTNCYAETLTLQKKWAGWGDNSPRVRSKGFWKDAYRYDRKAEVSQTEAEAMGENPNDYHPRMFTSLMDWLDPMAPIEWLADFLKVIHDCQNLDWLLLTKRPENWRRRCYEAYVHRLHNGGSTMEESHFRNWLDNWIVHSIEPHNVWFGTTVENQEMADKRIPVLLDIPSRIHWLSVEPLLETVNLGLRSGQAPERVGMDNRNHQINWIVVGGESGSKRRDCGVEAISNVADQCLAAEVPCFVKQDCAQKPGQKGRLPDDVWNLKKFPK